MVHCALPGSVLRTADDFQEHPTQVRQNLPKNYLKNINTPIYAMFAFSIGIGAASGIHFPFKTDGLFYWKEVVVMIEINFFNKGLTAFFR